MSDKGKAEQADSPDDTDGKHTSKNDKDDDNTDGENGKSEKDDKDKDKKNSGSDDENDVIKVARTRTSPALLSRLQHRRSYRQASALGAGGTGAAIWRVQRVTALALIPLALWFAISVVRLSMVTQAAAARWLAQPLNAALMAVFIVFALRHASIGLKIILEDYVENEAMRTAAILAVKTVALALGVACVAALIHLSI